MVRLAQVPCAHQSCVSYFNQHYIVARCKAYALLDLGLVSIASRTFAEATSPGLTSTVAVNACGSNHNSDNTS